MNKKKLRLLFVPLCIVLFLLGWFSYNIPTSKATSNVLGNTIYTSISDNGSVYLLGSVFISPLTGIVNESHFYTSGALGHHAIFGVYNNSTDELLYSSGIIDLTYDGWQNLTSSFSVTIGSAYCLVMQTDYATTNYHFIDGIGELKYVSRSFGELPDTLTGYSEISRTICAYCVITVPTTPTPTATGIDKENTQIVGFLGNLSPMAQLIFISIGLIIFVIVIMAIVKRRRRLF